MKGNRRKILETVHRLFIYTDDRAWYKLQEEVFAHLVHLDMSSMGGPSEEMSSKSICEMWQSGFEGIDAVNHLAGNHIVDIDGNEADVFCYATATHYKSTATEGNTREFVGSYNMHLVNSPNGWRINVFRYNLKYKNGNLDLK